MFFEGHFSFRPRHFSLLLPASTGAYTLSAQFRRWSQLEIARDVTMDFLSDSLIKDDRLH